MAPATPGLFNSKAWGYSNQALSAQARLADNWLPDIKMAIVLLALCLPGLRASALGSAGPRKRAGSRLVTNARMHGRGGWL
jgi:hypothetical protein